jgi:hypothetical protein
MSTGIFSRTYKDYDSELSNVQIYHDLLSSANFTTLTGLLVTMYAAMDLLQTGTPSAYRFANDYPLAPANPPSDPYAQREIKWRVDYHDNVTGEPFYITIPCADLSLLDPNDRAHAHIGDADKVDAFVTAFNAVAKSPRGNAVTIDEITAVGRNI